MDAKILLIMSVLITLGIYLLPSTVARLSGSHSWELNGSGGAASLECVKCHQYIYAELSATTESSAVLTAHRNAAGNTTYTSSTLLSSRVSNTTESELCLMCHLAKVTAASSHTQIIVRPCIDTSCHGTNESYENASIYPDARSMGPKLGKTNVHEYVFDDLSGFISPLLNETGANYSRGYFLCLGCHTDVGIGIEKTSTESFAHNDSNQAQRRYL